MTRVATPHSRQRCIGLPLLQRAPNVPPFLSLSDQTLTIEVTTPLSPVYPPPGCGLRRARTVGEARLGRPSLSWLQDDPEPNANVWATADEWRQEIVGRYRQAPGVGATRSGRHPVTMTAPPRGFRPFTSIV